MTDSNVLLLLVLLGVMCGGLPATEVKSREDASRAIIAPHAAYLGLQRQPTLQLRGGYGKARRQNNYENQRILQAEQERPQQRREGIERKERLRAQLLARSKINEMRDRMLQEGATERDINKLEEAMWRGDPIDPRFAQAHDEAQEVRSRTRDDDDDDDFQVMQGYSDTSSSTGSGERVQIFGPTPTEEEARANPRRYLPDFDPDQSVEEQVRLATTPQIRWGQRAPDLPNAEERLICLEQWNGEEAAQEAVQVEQAARARAAIDIPSRTAELLAALQKGSVVVRPVVRPEDLAELKSSVSSHDSDDSWPWPTCDAVRDADGGVDCSPESNGLPLPQIETLRAYCEQVWPRVCSLHPSDALWLRCFRAKAAVSALHPGKACI